MAIDPELFAKVAKVYEAAESVEGMKPKEVYESHKKCAPGEFGMNKEGETGKKANVPDPATTGMTGAGLGALIGALRAPKGKMLKYTLGGAGIGGAAGVGSAAAYNLVPAGRMGAGLGKEMLRVPLAIGGGALAGHLGNKLYNEVEGYIPEKKEKKDDKQPAKDQGEKQSARAFGEKAAASVNWQNVMNTGLGGAALGAGLGGLTGLVAPGTDENGRRRSRFGAMLRGALGGGLLGGGAGAAAEVASPNFGQSAMNMARNYGGDLYRRFFGKPQPIGSVDGQPLDDAALPEGTETNMIEAVNALKNDAQGQYDVTGQRFRNYMRSGQLPFTPGARSQYGVDADPARAQGLV